MRSIILNLCNDRMWKHRRIVTAHLMHPIESLPYLLSYAIVYRRDKASVEQTHVQSLVSSRNVLNASPAVQHRFISWLQWEKNRSRKTTKTSVVLLMHFFFFFIGHIDWISCLRLSYFLTFIVSVTINLWVFFYLDVLN